VTRPEHYEANRDRLVGEIACDVHGLFVTGRFLEQAFMHERDDPEKIELAYLPFAFTFFLLMWLADLHQAMIRWLKHWVEFGFDSAGTAGLSEMHFRKVAIVNALARHLCMTFIPEQFDTEEQFNKGRELIGATIGRFKECLDALIYMPVEIAVIRACKNIEGEAVKGEGPLAGLGQAKLKPPPENRPKEGGRDPHEMDPVYPFAAGMLDDVDNALQQVSDAQPDDDGGEHHHIIEHIHWRTPSRRLGGYLTRR
jgi:hypothetical protein